MNEVGAIPKFWTSRNRKLEGASHVACTDMLFSDKLTLTWHSVGVLGMVWVQVKL